MTQSIKNFTPREIVSELDRYIIGQNAAKRAVAIAMRNRWRRQQVPGDLRDEIAPKNIIMIGQTGVGKTEIARRLAKLANAPFIKVEASKFTEVGYVGKDVESMIRELTDIAVNMVKSEEKEKVQAKSEEMAEERILDILLPRKPVPKKTASFEEGAPVLPEDTGKTREKMRQMLRDGKLDERTIELDNSQGRPMGMGFPMVEVVSTGGSLDEISRNLKDMFSQFMPRGRKRNKVRISEAVKLITEEEAAKLIDMDEVIRMAIEKTEQAGMVFIDEIDKIASRERKGGGQGPDVSREGVQRDILPIVEGSSVSTRYGLVNTEHILFIAAGAFHVSKPSDLIPELQGRFPIRVELSALNQEDFLRILTEPQNSLIRQYTELIKTENVSLNFKKDALREICRFAALANEQMENIGARRLHTIVEKVLDDVMFNATEMSDKEYTIDGKFVRKSLDEVIRDKDLSRYIL